MSGRYAELGTASWTAPDGRHVAYLQRRLLPRADTFTTTRTHIVRAGERADTIAARDLGDPLLSWLLADANGAMRPSELAVRVGARLRVPSAEGVTVVRYAK
jgi:hypothetical protein